MQYVIYASHVSEMVLKTVLRHPSTVSILKHPIQLIRSLLETLRPEVDQKMQREQQLLKQ